MELVDYVRDGRSPVPESETTSRVMSANRGGNTGPELELRRALIAAGAGGYRLHWKNAPGRPDIAYPSRRLAIFVHGCFWHRCPHCGLPLPRTHTEFWRMKFERNVERDKRKVSALKAEGWKVLILWECEIEEDVESCAEIVREALGPVETASPSASRPRISSDLHR